MAIKRAELTGVVLDPEVRASISYWMPVRLAGNMWEALPEGVIPHIELLGSVRAISMTPAPNFGYDPIPLIRKGEKTHTVRVGARILGTVNQVAVNGARIPLWLRWTARERVHWVHIWTNAFAFADGIRPEGNVHAVQAMEQLWRKWHGRAPRGDQYMWVMHFEVFADLMDELEGRWES